MLHTTEERFREAVLRAEDSTAPRTSIGIYKEKRLHAVLKDCYGGEDACPEVQVGDFVADLVEDGEITEIQTGSFHPLKQKIAYYLLQTEFTVNVIHPLIPSKRLIWMDPETGELSSPHRSPKKEGIGAFLRELIYLLPYVGHPRLRFCCPLLSVEEYRMQNGWSRDGKKGSSRVERYPRELLGEWEVCGREDISALLPDTLPTVFTRKDFARTLKLGGLSLSAALKVCIQLGVVEVKEKKGKTIYYHRVSFSKGIGEFV